MRKNVLYTIYKKYDRDTLSVFRFVHTTKGIVEAYRKVPNGEFDLMKSSVGFAHDVYYQGDLITKEEYEQFKP